MDNSELADNIERQLLIDALSIGLIIEENKQDRLDNWFAAWRSRERNDIEIHKDLSLGIDIPAQIEPLATGYDDQDLRYRFDESELDWFSEQIMRLKPQQQRLIWHDVVHKNGKDRRKIDKWLAEFKLAGSSNWYNMRTRIRAKLIKAIINKQK